ncbi:hypothetical protein [Lysobacter olei]
MTAYMRAVLDLSDRRWLSPPSARLSVLRRLAANGHATQCGHLFHPSPACDRLAHALRSPMKSPQGDLFA